MSEINNAFQEVLYDKLAEKSNEIYLLKLAMIEVKSTLNLVKLGYRTIDQAIEQIDKEINK